MKDVDPAIGRIPGSEAALLEAARRGDAGACRDLFRQHASRVHRLAYRMVGARTDLDDLVQTIFIECFRSLPGFRGESLFSTWLGRITCRVCMRAVKRPALQTVPLDEPGEPPSAAAGPEDHASGSEGLRRLDALLSTLGPKRRTAFVMHVIEGYSIDEVSAMVGASTSAVKVRIHDARRELERRMRKDAWFAEHVTEEGQS